MCMHDWLKVLNNYVIGKLLMLLLISSSVWSQLGVKKRGWVDFAGEVNGSQLCKYDGRCRQAHGCSVPCEVSWPFFSRLIKISFLPAINSQGDHDENEEDHWSDPDGVFCTVWPNLTLLVQGCQKIWITFRPGRGYSTKFCPKVQPFIFYILFC